jgi:light-regulated signal transduction histidine kinase (bacteriophytochrome)
MVQAEVERGIDCKVRAPDDDGDPVTVDDPDSRRRARLTGHEAGDHVYERRLADGRWILVNEHRTDDGGTVILHTDVTELKDREVALTRSNRELEAFAAIASHDLQEPLRKIEAFGDRLARKYAEALGSDGRVYVEHIQVSASRVRALINDLLDYSRVTTRPRSFTAVDLGKVVADVIEDLAGPIRERSAKIEVGALPTIEADAVQMRQLFGQLLTNALEFHKPGEAPAVRITARPGDGQDTVRADTPPAGTCVVEITDDGIGFDTKYLDRIFTIFQRLHAQGDYAGTGVGLATCRKIVEGHGGAITARSTPGQGATFVVALPLRSKLATVAGQPDEPGSGSTQGDPQ